MSTSAVPGPGGTDSAKTKPTAVPGGLEVEKQLELVTRKLKGIEEISRALGSEHNLDRILDVVMDRTNELMNTERATLFVVDDDARALWSRVTRGGKVETIHQPMGQGIAGWVASNGRTVNVKDAYKDARFDSTTDQRSGFRTTSVLCSPMRDSQGQTLGVLQVLNKRAGYFTTGDEDLLAAIAAQAAISIHNSRLYLDVVGKNIDLQETSEHLQSRTAELELLFRIERAAATATILDDAVEGILEATLAEFPSEVATVVLTAAEDGANPYARVVGAQSERLAGSAYFDHVAGQDVLPMDAALNLDATRRGSDPPPQLDGQPDWAIRQLVSLPLLHQGRSLGCLQLVNRTDDGFFEDRDIRLLGLIAGRLVQAIVLARALEEEQQAERLASIGQMLSGVMHDLKTPLTIIGGYARLMSQEEDQAERKDHRQQIKNQIDLMKTMTQELLSFARGESELLVSKVFVADFLAELREVLEKDLEGYGVRLVVDAQYEGAVRLDAGKMKRVLYNLTRNAREAMPDGGTVTITVTADTDAIQFVVADDGAGIPPEMQGRLFESFATWGKENGTGLGLAIVERIIEQHRGTIGVDSAPGRGTSFTISLPR